MKNTAEYRALESRDQDFLFDMLFEAIYVPPGSPEVERSILELPEIKKYAASWGDLKGDRGILLSLEENPAGAVWLRFFRKEEQGYGYVADNIPELSMALLPEYRGQGYGTELLRRLLKDLPQEIQSISLSVDPGNPALHLYKKFGFNICGEWETSITMLFNRSLK
ncbi:MULTISPECIES: GNAT family N-acetyltransferase [unclassified Oceanispirochaeta]|uniref:GNAT family N-acetyltransferase n=1 Tax=unclassified Oceanispirochaeta TaxID=2635722 RepID=UPI000E09D52C|nr:MULTISPECIES: GNAT family N-acetyltransferase [unclassified Oceanispirochaeta]MBF9016318.1 GNAT family N-acetyltransferase [Oceanispirochaeta sp. M2]NPD72781.1 GNAT family N-acetyltransferase [Oceanispirochaeta sp. M1]RDG31626.1 GNAT family N-acetyltransferase [Oceanispirochaeta sp. M1]